MAGDDRGEAAAGGHAPTAVTMQDVARRAGVSQSTVSRILSGTETRIPIAASTRDRVLAIADELGYRPNPLARGLRGAATMLLGVIVRDISDPFFASAIEAISRHANARGYNVVLGAARGRADEAIALRAVLETRHCDGIVVLGDMRDQPRLVGDLERARTPVVVLWQGPLAATVPTIGVDNARGIEAALDHLLGLGHERIAFVSGRPLGDIQERAASFRARMQRAGLRVPRGYLQQVPNTAPGGERALRGLLELSSPPSAIVCSTDVLAMGVLRACATRGVRVPEDLSVVGFDDLPFSAHLVPALTTVRMPIGEMAERAVRVVVESIASGTREAPHEMLAPRLVVRESTGPHPGTPPDER